MTTSRQPWSLSPTDAAVVLDTDGRVVATFADPRDAELVADTFKTGETLTDLLAERDDLQKEVLDLDSENGRLTAENERLEKELADLRANVKEFATNADGLLERLKLI